MAYTYLITIQPPDIFACSCNSITQSLALTVPSFCQAHCPHKKAVTGLEIICCFHPPKPTIVQSGTEHGGHDDPLWLPPPKFPDAWLTHPWTGSLLISSSSCSELAPSPACLAPRPRCIPRWGKWVGVCQAPARREQQRDSITPGTVRPLGAGKGAVLLPGPSSLPSFKVCCSCEIT